MAPRRQERIAARLLRWYRARRRDLPWRKRPNPYRVWISEIMLQQTTVATAGPYFERFVRRYPGVRALAVARQEDVLALWSGLGYYHRARNLLDAARIIVHRHGGRIPADPRSLRDLPGIGPYTAGAILSIGHSLPYPAVDGNVMRVIARLAAIREDPARASTRKAVEALAVRWMPAGAASAFNQALMDLGATICTPRSPGCDRCPVTSSCRARIEGLTGSIPRVTKRARAVQVGLTALAVRRGDDVLLVRRAGGSLMEGLWEYPLVPASDDGKDAAAAARRLGATVTGEIGEVRHTITRHRLSIRVKEARVTAPKRVRPSLRSARAAAEPAAKFATTSGDGRWVPVESLRSGESGLALTGVARKISRLLAAGTASRRAGAGA